MFKSLDSIGVGGKYRYPALGVVALLTVVAFTLTRGMREAQASAETGSTCSDPAVTGAVSDIVRKAIFAGQGGVMFDAGRFGGQFANVVVEEERPLTCAADFRPVLAFNKSYLMQVEANPETDAGVAEMVLAHKLAARMTWTVRSTAAGGVRVQVVDGLEAFE